MVANIIANIKKGLRYEVLSEVPRRNEMSHWNI
jgi:hypothetical protein